MGNWNRHFVRVGSDGNVGIFDNLGNENLEIVRQPTQFGDYTSLQTPKDPNLGGISVYDQNRGNVGINANPINGADVGITTIEAILFFSKIRQYNSVFSALNGIGLIAGSPDLRTGVTAADASAITIFSSTVSGTRYEIKARILATSGSSATYTISWTEGGVAQKVALTITAVDTEVHDNFVIAPDAGTNITAQITSLTSSTVNVDAIVSVLG